MEVIRWTSGVASEAPGLPTTLSSEMLQCLPTRLTNSDALLIVDGCGFTELVCCNVRSTPRDQRQLQRGASALPRRQLHHETRANNFERFLHGRYQSGCVRIRRGSERT